MISPRMQVGGMRFDSYCGDIKELPSDGAVLDLFFFDLLNPYLDTSIFSVTPLSIPNFRIPVMLSV